MQIFENSLKTNNFTGRRQHTDVQNSAKHRRRKVMEEKRERGEEAKEKTVFT
jgi:hypothetical protein